MEDPWASGSAWATLSKSAASERPASPTAPTSPVTQSPPARFDVSDPWGVPTPASTAANPVEDHAAGWSVDDVDVPASPARPAETPGWDTGGGGLWEATTDSPAGAPEPEAGPSRSPPRRPQDSPEWGFGGAASTAPPPLTDLDQQAAHDDLDEDSIKRSPVVPPFERPTTPEDAYHHRPSPPAPLPTSLDDAQLPKSPSFGDDFGGFSSGFGDDPWGGRKQEAGWGGEGGESSRRSSVSSHQSGLQSLQHEEDDGDGWGGATSRRRRISDEREQKTGMDQEWEEAQHRIRVTEERAVCPHLSTTDERSVC